jgi:hypothetical protein
LDLLEILRPDVALGYPVSRKQRARIDERAGAGLVERHALALEIRDRLEPRALPDHDMHALGKEVRR